MRSKPAFSTLDQFTQAYVTAALWSSTDDKGEPLDKRYDWDNIRADSQQDIIADCAEFQQLHAEALSLVPSSSFATDSDGNNSATGLERAGHDYWLTRNGHGTGFWDREFADQHFTAKQLPTLYDGPTNTLGGHLTQACKVRGEVNIVESHNGTLCFSGRVQYLERPFVVREKLTAWQRQGLQQTATGYGSRLNSGLVLRIEGERLWRRIYAVCWSNVASHYVVICGRFFWLRMPDRSEFVS